MFGRIIAVLCLVFVSGCVLPGQWIEQKDLPCPGPQGWRCQSINKTYQDALSGSKSGGESDAADPPQNGKKDIQKEPARWMHLYRPPAPEWSLAMPREQEALQEGQPLRDPGEVLRIKIYDYVDKKGILYRGRYAYIEVRKPRWNPGARLTGKAGKDSSK